MSAVAKQDEPFIVISDLGHYFHGRQHRTKCFLVKAILGGQPLGEIRWYGQWRRYAFFPNAHTLFEEVCLRQIADFCENETRLYRAGLT